MHKLHDKAALKIILSDVINIAMQHMTALAIELKNLDITPDNMKSKSTQELMAAETMSNILTIINDVIHPAHDIMTQLFDKNVEDFVTKCKTNQKLAIDKKMINPKCECYACRGNNYGN